MKLDPRSTVAALAAPQIQLLRRYEELLRERAIPRGYVGVSDRARLWERHVVDSLRALACLPRRPSDIVDVGTGAGLPGIPIAIARPDCAVTLLEGNAGRSAFCELVAEDLALPNVRILTQRAEQSGVVADVALARALGSPGRTWEICSPLTRPSGFILYFAGRSWGAAPAWEMDDPEVDWQECVISEFPWQGPIVKMMRKRPSA